MLSRRKTVAGLVVATALTTFGAAAVAQSVITPYSPWESAPALSADEEADVSGGVAAACETPYSPNECGPATMPAVGGTAAAELGGRIESGSFDGLPSTPDSDMAVPPSD